MFKRLGYMLAVVLLAVTAVAPATPAGATGAGGGPGHYYRWVHHKWHPKPDSFVRQVGPNLMLNGKIFRFAGTNNYYLMYKPELMVDDVLETAAENDFKVVRHWGSFDIGTLDDTPPGSIHGIQDDTYFQYWEGDGPAYNDGETGLERLDYVIAKAGELGLKLVIPLTNNWQDFGGMDQYVMWREAQFEEGTRDFHHDDFYTDSVIREWYQNWIEHLLTRTNTITGIQYKDDPTIMTWELGNEPRCKGSGYYPMSDACTTDTLTSWADDISKFIKSIDSNHLVSVGDEGFYCDPEATDETHWTENCGEGVDTLALTALDEIDVMSYHLYPDHWGMDVDWGTEWIERHIKDARKLHKPAMLGEYGWQDASTRNTVFKEWTDTVFRNWGSGALYWILSGIQDEDGTLYPDYDGFTVYCPSPVCTTLANFADMMKRHWPMYFAPVADHESAVTEFATSVTFDPAANDIAYGIWNDVVPSTIDLDPATSGQQTEATVTGGTFTLLSDATVEFVPEAEFSGKVLITYTIRDRFGRKSNEAELKVTVKPDPGPPILIASFETGTEGWAAADWEPGAGTVTQSDVFVTEGSYGLAVDSIDGGWFGVVFETPLDLSVKSKITLDLQTTAEAGTWHNISLTLGDGWVWCQGPGEWVPQGTTMTAELDLLNITCEGEVDLSKVQRMHVYFNGDGYLDNVVAE